MKYEVKRTAVDPFDIMCGECVEHEVEWWEKVTEEELRRDHLEMLGADACLEDWEKEAYAEEFGWEPTPENFDEWITREIADGYIREVA